MFASIRFPVFTCGNLNPRIPRPAVSGFLFAVCFSLMVVCGGGFSIATVAGPQEKNAASSPNADAVTDRADAQEPEAKAQTIGEQAAGEPDVDDPEAADPVQEAKLISGARQLTLDGKRSGEGYFSADGSKMVFQSERTAENPFYQIYRLDLETGDLDRVSDGSGKTTCAWLHPDGQRVLFASTQMDPDAKRKQQEELEFRASGQTRRYAWDYDPAFDLLMWNQDDGQYQPLTTEVGYDAEGCISPDGQSIVFASNRAAYAKTLTPAEQVQLERDPSFFIDLYLMNSDGSNVRQLTTSPGYDGGPFFSADGQSICWRRFTADGVLAEIMTMDLASGQEQQVTRMNAMSWAPFFHPSGEYLIFTTNKHGFANFELYLVAADGRGNPVRVTYTPGFDGLPTFTPDGQQISWTSNRNSKKQSQIYLANWDHQQARKLLGLDDRLSQDGQEKASAESLQEAGEQAIAALSQLDKSILPQDIMRHVDYLCRQQLAGRGTGTPGEQLATAYVASIFDQLGLEPAGDHGTFFQEFEFTAGVKLGDDNRLVTAEASFRLDQDWRPVAFSANGPVSAAEVVFAGYGMAAPQTENSAEYDSYVHLDVRDKWVLVFRFMPEDISPERRQELARYQSLYRKAALARDKGAKGLIIVSGPNAQVRNELIPLDENGALQGSSLPIVSVSNEVATAWLATIDRDLKELQSKLDKGDLMVGLALPDVQVSAEIDIEKIRRTGRNVIGRLAANEESGQSATTDPGLPFHQAVLIGAHIDHLGTGSNRSSLATDGDQAVIHFGADDNASGVASLLEMAQAFASQVREGKLKLKRDLVFAAWSGEELGLIGANHFADVLEEKHGAKIAALRNQMAATANPENTDEPPVDPVPVDPAPVDPASGQASDGLYPLISANLNLDMVGRLRENLILQGLGSSAQWRSEIEQRNVPVGLSLTLQDDCDLPTDASAFYRKGVPILAAFTGSHEDYHKPSDTPEKLNYDGAAQVTKLISLIAHGLATADNPISFQQYSGQEQAGNVRAVMRAYLGTVPEYGADDVKGVLLSGVTKGAPAAEAGLQAGDIIVELSGKPIDNVYDYTYAIEALKVGQQTTITVNRKGERILLAITPGSRD